MAHFTGLKELQNHVHRSGFDLSSKNVFSAKAGELLPVYWDIGLPGCTYDINVEYFTRTRPVQTAAYTRIREYFDFYAVPIDLLWKSFNTSVIQMGDVAPIQAKDLLNSLTVGGDIPYCSLYDLYQAVLYANGNTSLGSKVVVNSGFESIHGFNRGDLDYKLLHMLNYGNFIATDAGSVGGAANRWFNMQAPLADSTYTQKYRSNALVNLFPLAAYQKIYQDFFRWSQWENADPTSYNFDWYNGKGSLFGSSLSSVIPATSTYWKRDNLFSLRYCNWNKDKFMGMLPNSQYGDVAVVDLSSSTSYSRPVYMQTGSGPISVVNKSSIQPPSTDISLKLQSAPGSTVQANSLLKVDIPATRSNLSILALRQAEALQKYREITQSVDTNYRDQIKAHFGVNVPASDSHMAQYIGGVARNLDISEVVNNNLQGDGEAVIYGKGVGTGTGSMRYSTGSRYCVLMCIYHCIPLLDYDLTGQDGQLLVTSVEDLPIPEFDNIGMESVPAVELFNSVGFSADNVNRLLGYLPRYYNWKTKIDRIHGAFTTTLKDWVAPINNDYLHKWFAAGSGDPTLRPVQWPFFKVNPNTLDSIFAVNADSTWETDQFLVNCHIGVKCVRPLSRDGMPY
uniref:Major capsid protein n=1 Tax=Microviridae sp. ctUTL4 TaxID=2827643 RepID=A0A8S5S4D5_9VIRU|nr:MAG TPA: Major capsid protein [Microviridae sp. ctUTL4]